MKAVILSLQPEANLVDLTHEVRAHDIREGAFLLFNAAPYFPRGTIFLAVVDPGVGSPRKGLIARAGSWILVGPDNGLFSFFWLRHPDAEVYELSSPHHRLPNISDTFHGRDVFAPAAAWAARGTPLHRFGPKLDKPVCLPSLVPLRAQERVEGVVVHVDRFGNLVSNLESEWLSREGIALDTGWEVRVGERKISRLVRTYAEAQGDQPVALWGSSGFLEISVREGSAAQVLGAKAGTPVHLVRSV
jgi:S-adenosylmethionine hydrolase